jgi:hypothetical protein
MKLHKCDLQDQKKTEDTEKDLGLEYYSYKLEL